MAHWREKVHQKLRTHLETQIAETRHASDAYLFADDPAIAQLWVAVANLTRQCFELNVKINNIDTVLRDSLMQQQVILSGAKAKQSRPLKPAKKKRNKRKIII